MSSALFDRLFPRIGAAIYVTGIVSFIATRILDLPVAEMPVALHAVILVAAAVAGFGFLLHFRQILARGSLETVAYALVTGHLLLSAVLHAWSLASGSNAWIGLFPEWYPYLAIAYFAVFAWLCWRFPSTERGRRSRLNGVGPVFRAARSRGGCRPE